MKKLILAMCLLTFMPDNSWALSESEAELYKKSAELSAELENKGMILKNDEIATYVSDLGNKLVPAGSNIKFHVLKDPSVNAFALPDGNVYVNLGLIARLENEMQLAQALAHESGHVIKQHSLSAYDSNRSSTKAAHFLDLALFGTGIAYIPFAASIMDYSRDHEREADEYAYQALSDKGYDMSRSHEIFERFGEVKKGESVEGSIWGSHPGDKERAANAKEIFQSGKYKTNENGKVGTAEYKPIRKAAISKNTELKILAGHYNLALEAVELALADYPQDANLFYLKGEALRNLGTDPESAAREEAWINDERYSDEDKKKFADKKNEYLNSAKESYSKSISVNGGFANSYKGRGLTLMALGDKQAAKNDLQHYAKLAPSARDKRYINKMIEDCSK